MSTTTVAPSDKTTGYYDIIDGDNGLLLIEQLKALMERRQPQPTRLLLKPPYRRGHEARREVLVSVTGLANVSVIDWKIEGSTEIDGQHVTIEAHYNPFGRDGWLQVIG